MIIAASAEARSVPSRLAPLSQMLQPRRNLRAQAISLLLSTLIYLALIGAVTLLFWVPLDIPHIISGTIAVILIGCTIPVLLLVIGRLPAAEVTASYQHLPALQKLVAQIADKLDVPEPTIVINETFSAAFARIGWRRQPVLVLGHPFLALLDDSEIVTVIAHEMAHGRDGSITRSVYVRLATTLLATVNCRVSAIARSQIPLISVGAQLVAKVFNYVERLLEQSLHADHHAAELRADHLALSISGERNPTDILKKMLYRYMPEVESAYSGAEPEARVKALRSIVNRVPDGELNRRWLKALGAPSSIDPMHPALEMRCEFLNARAGCLPEVRISAELSPKIQEEIILWPARLDRQLKGYEQSDDERFVSLIDQINCWNRTAKSR